MSNENDSNNAKVDLIYDLLQKLDGKQDHQSERLTRLEVNVDRNSDSLDEHIEGVVQTRVLIEQNKQKLLKKQAIQKAILEKRLEELERPKLVAKSVGKFIVYIGTIGAGLYGIYRGYLAIQGLF